MSKQKRCSFLISFDSGCAVACVRQPKCWQTGRRLRLRFASADVVRAAMCGALLVCVCVFAFSSLSLSACFALFHLDVLRSLSGACLLP